MATLSPANLEKPVSRKWEQRVAKSLLESETAIALKSAQLEYTKRNLQDTQRFNKLLTKIDLKGMDEWSKDQKDKVYQLMNQYHDLFALEDKELGKTSLVKHKIKTNRLISHLS